MSKPAITWHPEKRQVSDLKLWKNNPRKITSEAFLKLKERISERGFHDVLKIDTDGVVLSGNQRKKALTDLEILEVTVLVPDRPIYLVLDSLSCARVDLATRASCQM